MNRRSFLSMMGFVAPAVIVKPTYFFAPRDGWGIKIYPIISQYADYTEFVDVPLRTATGADLLTLYFNPCFIRSLKGNTTFRRLTI